MKTGIAKQKEEDRRAKRQKRKRGKKK